ncbi:MAG: aminoglycoside phosphotransferase family protein [Chloroflexota bacterium]|nr:aminoglycoside phosphotransferase family protein [Chloroflexota bacterium]
MPGTTYEYRSSPMSGFQDKNARPDRIPSLLADIALAGNWTIARSSEGSSERTFVARQQDRAVFVKLGDRNPARERLAELGITPPLLATGEHDGAPFSVYEFVPGRHPDPAWIADHRLDIADIILAFQQDGALADALGGIPDIILAKHLDEVLRETIISIQMASSPRLHAPEVAHAITRLTQRTGAVDDQPLVPSHTDPNNTNLLVATERAYLIDWDGITWSEPLRDIGLMLWWYIPEARWRDVLLRMDVPEPGIEGATERVHWWSAINSLRVALWIDRNVPDEGAIASFLEDLFAAEARRPNPKRRVSK